MLLFIGFVGGGKDPRISYGSQAYFPRFMFILFGSLSCGKNEKAEKRRPSTHIFFQMLTTSTTIEMGRKDKG